MTQIVVTIELLVYMVYCDEVLGPHCGAATHLVFGWWPHMHTLHALPSCHQHQLKPYRQCAYLRLRTAMLSLQSLHYGNVATSPAEELPETNMHLCKHVQSSLKHWSCRNLTSFAPVLHCTMPRQHKPFGYKLPHFHLASAAALVLPSEM